MRFSEMSAQQQNFLTEHLGHSPASDKGPDQMPEQGAFEIFVRNAGGKTLTLEVWPTMAISGLFAAFVSKAGYPPNIDGYLTTGTKALGGTGTVGDFGIQKHATLQFNLRMRGGDSREISKKTLDAAHAVSANAAQDPRARPDGIARLADADPTPITEGEAKWKLTRDDATAGLEKRRVSGRALGLALQEMGYTDEISVVRIPPKGDIAQVTRNAEQDFDEKKTRETYHELKKRQNAGEGSSSMAARSLSDVELMDQARKDYQKWLAGGRGADGQRDNAVNSVVAAANKDKKWLTESMESGKANTSYLTKQLDESLKTNPGMLIEICKRRVPELPANAGYQQNCVTDVLSMDDGFRKVLMDTIIGNAEIRPDVTHGNEEKKLPSKRNPFSAEADDDLYVEYGVQGGGGLRLVQNLETGDMYLSAHYAHFYLIEENGGPPEAANLLLVKQKRRLLIGPASEVVGKFGGSLRKIANNPEDDTEGVYDSFYETAYHAMINELKKLKKLRDKTNGDPYEDKDVKDTLMKISTAFNETIQPVLTSKAHLLAAEDTRARDRFVGLIEDYHTNLGPRIAALESG